MNQKQILAAVEAMLFACGDPIGADKLAQAVLLRWRPCTPAISGRTAACVCCI